MPGLKIKQGSFTVTLPKEVHVISFCITKKSDNSVQYLGDNGQWLPSCDYFVLKPRYPGRKLVGDVTVDLNPKILGAVRTSLSKDGCARFRLTLKIDDADFDETVISKSAYANVTVSGDTNFTLQDGGYITSQDVVDYTNTQAPQPQTDASIAEPIEAKTVEEDNHENKASVVDTQQPNVDNVDTQKNDTPLTEENTAVHRAQQPYNRSSVADSPDENDIRFLRNQDVTFKKIGVDFLDVFWIVIACIFVGVLAWIVYKY